MAALEAEKFLADHDEGAEDPVDAAKKGNL